MVSAELMNQVQKLVVDVAKYAHRDRSLKIENKGVHDFVTGADKKISNILSEELPKLLEGSAVISEEGERRDLSSRYSWVIDPIDGTSNFMYGNPCHAVSVGLLEGTTSVLGVIYAPMQKEMFYAMKGCGAFCNGEKICVSADETISHALVAMETNPYIDRKINRFSKIMGRFFDDCIDIRILGSAALACSYVADGRCGVFVAEGVKPWDIAAGDIIIREAGGKLTLWNGEAPTFMGNENIIASSGALYDEARQRMKDFA